MKITRTRLLLWFVMLTLLGSLQKAEGQWALLKASLQDDVRILEETPTRLILCREDCTATLVITMKKSGAADIFAGQEARRGGNPYRIWTTTESFWQKPHLSEDGGKKFFRTFFIKTLRTEPVPEISAPADSPVETEKEPEIQAPVSIESLAEQVPQQESAVENIPTTTTTTADTAREQIEDVKRAVAPSRSQKPAQRSKRGRRQRSSAEQTTAIRTATDKLQQNPPAPPPPQIVTIDRAATLDSLYHSALIEIEKENWQEAVLKLEDLQLRQPNYRDVADRLVTARINRDMAQKASAPAPSRKSSEPSLFAGGALAAVGAFVALIVLPMVGVILLSTGLRARYYLFRGDHAEAARLYENKLARRPGKTRLYADLANVYLFLGRRDEQALKVYKMVLQLKLSTKNREAINAIVAQSYLAESRTDANMIEVLENALKAERKKLGQGPEKQ